METTCDSESNDELRIDADMRLVRSAITGDWRFVTSSSSGEDPDATTPPVVDLPVTPRGTRKTPRRRCYVSMRPEDMGVNLTSVGQSAGGGTSTQPPLPEISCSSTTRPPSCPTSRDRDVSRTNGEVVGGQSSVMDGFVNGCSSRSDCVAEEKAAAATTSFPASSVVDDERVRPRPTDDGTDLVSSGTDVIELRVEDHQPAGGSSTTTAAATTTADLSTSSIAELIQSVSCPSTDDDTLFIADQDLEAELLSARLLSEFREAVRSAVQSISSYTTTSTVNNDDDQTDVDDPDRIPPSLYRSVPCRDIAQMPDCSQVVVRTSESVLPEAVSGDVTVVASRGDARSARSRPSALRAPSVVRGGSRSRNNSSSSSTDGGDDGGGGIDSGCLVYHQRHQRRASLPDARQLVDSSRQRQLQTVRRSVGRQSTGDVFNCLQDTEERATPTGRATPKSVTRVNKAAEDETDFSSGSRPTSGSKGSLASTSSRVSSASKQAAPANSGAVDEETFEKQFEQVPTVNIFSPRELNERIGKIRDTLGDVNLDWMKRVDALRELRSCFLAGATDYPDFVSSHLSSLEPCLQQSVRDLRSQVVREACITIAYMARELGKDFGHFAEFVLPALVLLLPNSVKVMASSGTTAVRFIIKFTHAPRLIPIITSNFTSKSNVIRKQSCEFLLLMLQMWPTQMLERHVAALQDAIKRGICDADADARVTSRRAFWSFAEHFRSQAESLLGSLDSGKQKQLLSEQPSNSSSTTSLNSLGRSCPTTPSRTSRSRAVSTERNSTSSSQQSRLSLAASQAAAAAASYASRGYDGNDVLGGKSLRGASSSYGSLDPDALASGLATLVKSKSETGRPMQQNNSYSSLPRPRKPSMTNGSGAGSNLEHSGTTVDRSRTRIRPSQSQPSSRSGSPSSRLSYITQTHPDTLRRGSTTGGQARSYARSSLPKSQGASRESSPSRASGRERRLSGGQTLSHSRQRGNTRSARDLLGTDVEAVMADALHGASIRNRTDSYDSDDFVSETSSVCSDGGLRSFGANRPHSEDMSEIISFMSSGAWSDRRDGLYALQNYIQSRTLTRVELKRVTEIFTRMFHDPHGKVFSVFLDTLTHVVAVYNTELVDWLYICITRLLSKTGMDMLASVQAKIQRALESIRMSFNPGLQFGLLARFIVDQTQSPNIKVKVSMLSYMHSLVLMLEPTDFVNSSDVRLAVSRIVTWTTEPKSVDVRKAAQAVLIALYNLNPGEFMTMLSVLPKTFQDGANRIIQNHLRSGATETSSQSSVSPQPTPANRYRPSSGSDIAGDNLMKPEDVYDNIRRTTADIRQYVTSDYSSSPPLAQKDITRVTSSGHHRDVTNMQAAAWHLPVVRSPEKQGKSPQPYTTTPSKERNTRATRGRTNIDADGSDYYSEELSGAQRDAIQDILIELSDHSDRSEERKSALLTLIKKAREEGPEVWDEYFNAVLLILLETVVDSDAQIRALALRVLAEFLRCHSERFGQYIEATIVKTLEAHRDPVKEVTRAAEECAMLLARFIAADRSILVLAPMIECEEFPINLAAIKMLTQLTESNRKEAIVEYLPEMIPPLLKGYDHSQSSVRKATVVCLVALYLCVGEDLRPFLKDLNGSKIKLLNVYIKRALEQRGENYAMSETSSPTSVVDVMP